MIIQCNPKFLNFIVFFFSSSLFHLMWTHYEKLSFALNYHLFDIENELIKNLQINQPFNHNLQLVNN